MESKTLMVYGWQKLKSIDFWDRSKCSGRLALNEGVLGSVCASCLHNEVNLLAFGSNLFAIGS